MSRLYVNLESIQKIESVMKIIEASNDRVLGKVLLDLLSQLISHYQSLQGFGVHREHRREAALGAGTSGGLSALCYWAGPTFAVGTALSAIVAFICSASVLLSFSPPCCETEKQLSK